MNFRKDGSPFWNQLCLAPVFDVEGRISHYLGLQSDVTAAVLQHGGTQSSIPQALCCGEAMAERLHCATQVKFELHRWHSQRSSAGWPEPCL